MRRTLIVAMLLLGAAAPVLAQDEPLPRRVDRIEKELRAVQRKVFPGGQPVEPEIAAPATAAPAPGDVASTPVIDLTARVDALERQLATLTGQSEQNSFKIRQLEESFARFRAEAAPPAVAPPPAEGGPAAPVLASPTLSSPDAGAAIERPATGDDGDDAYVYGYRLWEAKRYPEAEAALKAMVAQYPTHRRASYARNLLGRAYLDDGKPAMASVAFYENYQKMPKGDRAPESLYWLGEALQKLKKPADACKVYAQFDEDYGATAGGELQARVARGRQAAKCPA